MANNPPKGQNDTKKKIKVLDDLSDSDSSLPDIECDTCGISFTDVNSYKKHMQGKKHHKKIAEAKFMAKNLVANKKEPDDSDDDDDSNDMHCEVCDKNFTGYVSYATHIKGSVHAKNVKKQKLKEQLADMPEVLDKSGKHDDSDDDGILGKPYAICGTCQKEFSGPEPFKMHIKSEVHKKKVKQSQKLEILKAKYEDKAKASDDEEFFSKCDVCQKSFSGLVPYQIHMESNVHKKGIEKKKAAEEIKEFCANDDFEAGYVCKECKKTFTDPMAFKVHLANNSHEKQKAKDALLELLSAHPEIVFVTPFDKDGSEKESDDDDDDSMYYLICKLCHVSFSGPESAQDHVKSKKHISVKKEKKMLKLLKEQKKKSSEKSDDKKLQNNSNNAKEILTNGKPKSSENSTANKADDFELI